MTDETKTTVGSVEDPRMRGRMKLIDGVQASAVLSPCGTYRYRLSRRWTEGQGIACFVMLNPSTADADQDDPTLRKVQHYARSWGCQGVDVVNLYALRSTDPRALRSHPDPVGPENSWYLGGGLCRRDHDGVDWTRIVVAAWGANAEPERAAAFVDSQTRLFRAYLHVLGLTKAGQPKHPLYLLNTAQPQIWKGPR